MLEKAIELKKSILDLKERIQMIEEDNDLPAMRDILKAKEKDYQSMLKDCFDNGITSEGSIRIVTTYRGRRGVRFKEFLERYPNIATTYAKISVTAAEKALTGLLTDGGMEKKDAKEEAQSILDEFCDMEGEPKFDVVDLVEGD
ncbi:MAG: hypothetical protein WCS74_01375 [Dehalococcoidales bacterium]|jgi:hypothetical protein